MKELKFVGEIILVILSFFIITVIVFLLCAAILFHLINLYSAHKWGKESIIIFSLGFGTAIAILAGITYYLNFKDNYDFDFDFLKNTIINDIIRTYFFMVFLQVAIMVLYGTISNVIDNDFKLVDFFKKWVKTIALNSSYFMIGVIIIKEALKHYFLARRIKQTNQGNLE